MLLCWQAPEKDDWGTGHQAMQSALELEKHVNQALLDLHKTADSHGDAQMCDFIEANYLTEQVSFITHSMNQNTHRQMCLWRSWWSINTIYSLLIRIEVPDNLIDCKHALISNMPWNRVRIALISQRMWPMLSDMIDNMHSLLMLC